jgi:phosphoribosylformylglycinamidine cyclo-ligase
MTMIARAGVEPAEMARTFNMGLGMIVAVPAGAAAAACAALAGAQGRVVGAIVPRAGGAPSRLAFAAARP